MSTGTKYPRRIKRNYLTVVNVDDDIDYQTISLENYRNLHIPTMSYNRICNMVVYDRVDLLKYARDERGYVWSHHKRALARFAARKGHIACLQYLNDNECPWNERTCEAAASHGQLGCLQYLHENGCPWDENTTLMAACYGHLDCLRYAHEHGCPWNKTCSTTRHLECLRYAHENGCPWDEQTCLHAACFGYLDCLKYAHDHGCPWVEKTPCWWSYSPESEK